MARPLWKGAITFGLVSIPIEVHTAVRDRQLRFHLLTAKDRARVKVRARLREDSQAGRMERSRQGIRIRQGPLRRSDAGRLRDGGPGEDTHDRHPGLRQGRRDRQPLLREALLRHPGAGGDRAYVLLRETIRETERIGIAKFVLRERQHLAALEVIDDALVLTTLRFAEESIPASEYDFPASKGLRPPS